MNIQKHRVALAAALFVAVGVAASAQPAAGPAIDPGAVAALDRMGAYLRTVKTFRATAKTTRDKVLDDGLLVQRDGKADILAQFPSHLRIDTVNGERQRLYLYDGKLFTLYGQASRYYATVAAPATIGQLAAALADKYDIELPLEDLFWWGTERVDANAIVAAADAGPGRRAGHHLRALRLPPGGSRLADLDPELGDNPLPRKLVITTTTDESRPQYSATYTWDLAPSFNEAAFTFVPPSAEAKRIVFGQRHRLGRRELKRRPEMHKLIFRQTTAAFLTALLAATTGLALPNKPGGGGGGGGGSRGQAKSSVNNAGGNRDSNKNRNQPVNENKNVNVNQNKNVNRNTNVNVDRNRDIDIDVDVDHRHGGYGYNNGCCYNNNPIPTAAAVTATAVVTAAVVGSIVNQPPAGCITTVVNGMAYQQCGSTWYQPQYAGTSVTYMVVGHP